ncbi:MAG: imidazole glycerol phosphate synthase subunit HisH [Luteolibacter sp.]|jgi:imidazole glycerol-phosphate synthase subunit HisH
MTKTALIDYGAGNLRSVANALQALGTNPEIISTPAALSSADRVVLPGVGSFGDCMAQLDKRGLIGPLREWLTAGRPYLGICLGYQILFESSEETPGVQGLGALAGKVVRFKDAPGIKIPHMGWNAATQARPESGYWNGLGPAPYFYYVHSYFPAPDDPAVIAATTEHGGQRFAAAIERPNLLACQFHPEKSQDAGLKLIANFLEATSR